MQREDLEVNRADGLAGGCWSDKRRTPPSCSGSRPAFGDSPIVAECPPPELIRSAEHLYVHGGDTYGLGKVIDFSANLNPLGMPDAVRRAITESVDDFAHYPDSRCRDLTAAIAESEGVPAEWVVCTAGASDAILRACLAVRPRAGLVCAPTFSEYERSLEIAGVETRFHDLREGEGFELTDRVLEDLRPDIDLAFFCTPNNPTGLTIDRKLLVRILQCAREVGTVVVLDECFLCFTGEPSAVELCGHFPNLVVIKAFTKLYAMAGLRLGYAVCADAALTRSLRTWGPGWAVSGPAQAAGLAALRVPGWQERTFAYVAAARERLVAGLRSLGLRVIGGAANYVLFQSPVPLADALLERGLLIRSCANYRRLDASWYRAAVRTHEENERLIEAISEVLA